MPEPSTKRALMAEENRLWAELHQLVDSLPEDDLTRPDMWIRMAGPEHY